MYYLIYKITNIINGKFYIGKHKTLDINDGYMGSGKLITRAIKKYGLANFQKEILFFCTSEEEMNAKERELVVLNEQSYNLCPGGQGGFGFINMHGLNWTHEKNSQISGFKNMSCEDRARFGRLGGEASKDKTIARNKKYKGISKSTDHLTTPEVINKRKDTYKLIKFQQGANNSQYGKQRSQQTKDKISSTNIRLGKKPPSQKGTKWWNNGIRNTRSKESPGDDWVEGFLQCKNPN